MRRPQNIFTFLLIIISTASRQTSAQNDALQSQTTILLSELQSQQMDAVLYWNHVTLQACANDYDPAIKQLPDQLGPAATTRAFAIIHGAMYDAMALVSRNFRTVFTYSSIPRTNTFRRVYVTDAAIMEAAFQTLGYLYPTQITLFLAARSEHIRQQINRGAPFGAISRGIDIGQTVAITIAINRASDGSEKQTSYTPINAPGYHDRDPTVPDQIFIGSNWPNVRPFMLDSGSQYRPPNFVGDTLESRLNFLRSPLYRNYSDEVRLFGAKNSTVRTTDQTEIGIAWAYDAAPKIGVPPRLYNQVVRVVAVQQRNTLQQNAHLFALINYAMGDAGIAAWDAKYYYNFWRPIVAIRRAIPPNVADPNWLPLGSPADNNGADFTPPFPAYVSGHSTLGSSVFETLRLFYGTDNIPFRFQSDEFNGKTVDSNTKQPRPAKTRSYNTFTDAETENYLSRIYLGVHWRSDQEEGRNLGRSVARHVYRRLGSNVVLTSESSSHHISKLLYVGIIMFTCFFNNHFQ